MKKVILLLLVGASFFSCKKEKQCTVTIISLNRNAESVFVHQYGNPSGRGRYYFDNAGRINPIILTEEYPTVSVEFDSGKETTFELKNCHLREDSDKSMYYMDYYID